MTRPAPGSAPRRTGLLAVTLTLVLAGCDGGTVTGSPQRASGSGGPTTAGPTTGAPTTSGRSDPTGAVTWGETTESISNFMPLISAGNSTANGNLTVRVLDGLYRSAPNLTYVPDTDQGTATSTVVGGQQVVDITIADKAVWADGQPITAADYAFTIAAQKSYDPAKGGCAALLSTTGYDQVARTEAVGDKELKVYFATPFADWKGLFSGSSALLLAKHVVDQGSPAATCAYITKGWPVAGGIPLGNQNGPWLLKPGNVESGGRRITLVPNPRYWGDPPKLAKLVYLVTDGGSDDANLSALRNGEVDAIYPQPQLDLLANLKALSGVQTEIGFGSAFEHLDFNTRDPLLKLPQVRKAIALAVDRRALVAQTVGRFSDRAVPLGNRLVLNTQQGYVNNGAAYDAPNIARAKALIQSVGGRLGGDGLYRIGGRALTFRVMTTLNNPLRDQTVTRLAAQVRAAGIGLTEFANADIFGGSDKSTSLVAGGFQIALFAWVGSASITSSNSIYQRPSTSGIAGQNYTAGGTPAVDAALQRITTAPSASAEIAAANAADKVLWAQMYTLPLYQKPTLLAFRSTISGLSDNPSLAGPLWNSDDISVK